MPENDDLRLKRTIEILGELVAFDTTSALSSEVAKPNRPLIDFVRNFLEKLGIASTIVATEDQPGKACLWATIGPDSKEGGIVLAGHTDVVPVQRDRWQSDPFTLTERDGKLYGRGACDMKAFIACALSFIEDRAINQRLGQLKAPLRLALTYDEEITMAGAQRLTEWLQEQGMRPSWVWIGEPTTMRIVDAHKGVAEYNVEITGKACHSGLPHLGVSAIACACEIAQSIAAKQAEKQSLPFANSRFAPPYTTFNVGKIEGGQAANIVAGSCRMAWQVRIHPGDETAQTLRQSIETKTTKKWGKIFAEFPGTGLKTTTVCDIPPLEPTPENPASAALETALGGKPQTVSFATEGGIFQKIAAPQQTPIVICGPGDIAVAHSDHEHVTKDQLALCLDAMDKVFCAAPTKKK
ncbi:MAG: acetylornithine deacetylase [Bdellovibrionales bacterium]